MPAIPIGRLASNGTCVDDTHNAEYNERIDGIDSRLETVEAVTPPGNFVDLTGLGVQSSFNVPANTRRVRFLWNPVITVLNWPGLLATDALGLQFHGLYNEFPTNPAQRRHSERVVSDGVAEIVISSAQDSVAPTPVDVWIEK